MDKLSEDREFSTDHLTPLQHRVTQEKGTEPAFTGKYDKHDGKGMYTCAVCGNELFSSDTKFDSGTGWPSFVRAQAERVGEREDVSRGMRRTEVVCNKCGAHLGHVFPDGPEEHPSGEADGRRYCINSASLDFQKK